LGGRPVKATSDGRCRGPIAAIIAQLRSANRQMIEYRAENDEMPTTDTQHQPRDERRGTW
jgi:hypothetical protein